MKKIIALFSLFFILSNLTACQKSQTQASAPKNQATISVKFDRNSQKVFKNASISDKETVMDLLKAKTTVKEQGGFITAIDGHSQSVKDKIYWMFKVNGKLADKGAAQTLVKNHDQVEFYLAKY